MRNFTALLGALFVLAVSSVASAQDSGSGSTYESRRTDLVLERHEWQQDPEPEGKRVAFIHIERDDVFVPEEFWPLWFNWFHWLTKKSVVESELLVQEGDVYSVERGEEMERNLRDLGIFSLVRVVAVKTADPNAVGLVVHTRDLWSLRLEQDFQISSQVDYLLLQLTERNLFGLNQNATLRFDMRPDTFALGEVYSDHRFLGQKLALSESFDLIFNRSAIDVEGSRATLSLSRPFYNLSQHWGFDLSGGYEVRVARQLRDGEVLTYDNPATNEQEAMPRTWDSRHYSGAALGLYRFGDTLKQTFGVGFSAAVNQVELNGSNRLATEENRAAFEHDVLPRTRTDVGPTLRYSLFTPTYTTFTNLAAYGWEESVRVGPQAELAASFPLETLGSTDDAFVFKTSFGFTAAPGHALIDASFSSSSRLTRGQVIDQSVAVQLRGATPMLGPVRLVGRVLWKGRHNDSDNSLVSLGGDNGLRGYLSQEFPVYGGNLMLGNFELRTVPLVWQSIHLGLVAFYDVGAVYKNIDHMVFHHAVGLGVRLLFPQFNRYPFRFDGGVPIESGFKVRPSFAGSQALRLTNEEDAESP